jgi:BMFP domain-containing protein YqiC
MINGVDNFEEIKNHAIDQCDRPKSITRKEAEKLVRQILKGKLGSLPENIFKESVDMLMEEVNGSEVIN